jgi:hypothetical protein
MFGIEVGEHHITPVEESLRRRQPHQTQVVRGEADERVAEGGPAQIMKNTALRRYERRGRGERASVEDVGRTVSSGLPVEGGRGAPGEGPQVVTCAAACAHLAQPGQRRRHLSPAAGLDGCPPVVGEIIRGAVSSQFRSDVVPLKKWSGSRRSVPVCMNLTNGHKR